jgi:hypothetical protein
LSVNIPAGAVTSPVQITIRRLEPPPPLPPGFLKISDYKIDTGGASFQKDIVLTFRYGSSWSEYLQYLREQGLGVYHWDGIATWTGLTTVVDTSAHTVTASTSRPGSFIVTGDTLRR